jgi:signal transduction histidine kinase
VLLNARQVDHLQTIIISLVDITERKLAKDILARHAVELQRAVDERTNELSRALAEMEHFSYALVHDLRAPLRAMHVFAELLLEEQAVSPAHPGNSYAERIKSAARRLDLLVTDALSYSKALLQDLVLEPVSLAALIPGLIESYPDFQPCNAKIEVAASLPTVLGTEAALTQCFSNLLSNAVRFAKPGSKPKVRITAGEPDASASSKGVAQPSFDPPRSYPGQRPGVALGRRQGRFVRIWVEDEGIGVPSDSTRRIFGVFQQAANAREGTGIGLAIVRKVVHQMGGEVGVESQQGKGSRFWVELQEA